MKSISHKREGKVIVVFIFLLIPLHKFHLNRINLPSLLLRVLEILKPTGFLFHSEQFIPFELRNDLYLFILIIARLMKIGK